MLRSRFYRTVTGDSFLAGSAESRRLDADAPTGVRNGAMIALAWRSGLRIGEVHALKPKDVDLELGTITIQYGKGDKRRIVGTDASSAALGGPLDGRPPSGGTPCPWRSMRRYAPG